MSQAAGMLISKRLVTLHELQTVYGNEDFYNLIEIAAVDSHNQMLANKGK